MGSELNPKYKSTQPELYAICGLAWAQCKAKQADVVLKYPIYTMAYIDAKILKVDTAEALPDAQSRDSVSEIAQNNLLAACKLAVENWDFLSRYITESLVNDKANIKPSLEAAGKQYHTDATKEHPDWEKAKTMLTDGKSYMTNNAGPLTGFMPAGFDVTYDGTRADFLVAHNAFLLSEIGSTDGTYDKIRGNNDIYDEVISLLGDLVLLAPDALKNNVTFAHLKTLVSSPGPAGYKGTVTDSVTGLPIEGVLFRLTPTDREAISGADGKFDFGSFPSGTYVLDIIKDGYVTQTKTIKIHIGVTSSDDYVLVPGP